MALIIPELSRKKKLALAAGFLIVLFIVLWAVTRYLSPAPPRTVTMTTGAADGAYHKFGENYKEFLAANGIKLELQTSAGSVQNLERLQQPGTHIGFVQGGLGQLSINPTEDEEKIPLRSLSVIGYEPVWIFTSSPALADKLSAGLQALDGKKVGVGAEGSGTRKVALKLLKAYDVDAPRTSLEPVSGMTGVQALEERKIDALILIASPQAAAVQKLLDNASVGLVSLSQAEGLARRYPYLSVVSLKAGSVNPARNIPDKDINLLSTTANLVVRQDIHPAIAFLLLEAARDIHKTATIFSRPGEFPHPRGTDFPLAEEASRYYKDGRPFLQRYLPFWLANALQRLLLILIPLAAIGIPVIKFIPEILNFRHSNRFYRRYEELQKMEFEMQKRQLAAHEIESYHKRLDEIASKISKTKFPLEFADRVYTLRQHVDFVRSKLVLELAELQQQKVNS
jgi:TRAP transporter TAXI family solute receptor